MRVVSGQVFAALVGALLCHPAAIRADANPYFAGKTITIYMSAPPGGGYDLYGRLLARHLGDHIPGNPAVVVSNIPEGRGPR